MSNFNPEKQTLKVLLSTLGYNIFEETRAQIKAAQTKKEDIFYCRGKGIEATGEYTDEGLVVFRGSQMVLETAPKMQSYVDLRNKLIQDNVVIKKGTFYSFQSDYIFKSPSAASSAILGRPSNGWNDWKDENGRSLDDVKRKSI